MDDELNFILDGADQSLSDYFSSNYDNWSPDTSFLNDYLGGGGIYDSPEFDFSIFDPIDSGLDSTSIIRMFSDESPTTQADVVSEILKSASGKDNLYRPEWSTISGDESLNDYIENGINPQYNIWGLGEPTGYDENGDPVYDTIHGDEDLNRYVQNVLKGSYIGDGTSYGPTNEDWGVPSKGLGIVEQIKQAILGQNAAGTKYGPSSRDLVKAGSAIGSTGSALKGALQLAKGLALLGGLKESSNNSLSARGSTGTVNWGSGSQRAAPKFYADGGLVSNQFSTGAGSNLNKNGYDFSGYKSLGNDLRHQLRNYGFNRRDWRDATSDLQSAISGANADTLAGIMSGAGYTLGRHGRSGPPDTTSDSTANTTGTTDTTSDSTANTTEATDTSLTFPSDNANPQAFANYGGRAAPKFYAKGGRVNNGGLGSIVIALADKARAKGLIPGAEGGQDDNVEARLSPGEYVMDAETVSALGDGNTQAGAKKLDQMRNSIRSHKRSGGLSSIPPKAKEPSKYMKG